MSVLDLSASECVTLIVNQLTNTPILKANVQNFMDIKILSMFCVFEMIFRNHVHLNYCGLLSVTAQWQVTLSYD